MAALTTSGRKREVVERDSAAWQRLVEAVRRIARRTLEWIEDPPQPKPVRLAPTRTGVDNLPSRGPAR